MATRNLFIILFLLGVGTTGALYYKMYYEPPLPPPAAEPVRNPYKESVAATGIVEATKNNIAIGTPVSGLIKEVYVSVSDQVKKGQPLFAIDDRDLIAGLYVQETSVIVAEANLKKVQDQLARLRSIKDERAISKEEITTKENDVAIADAQLKQAIAKTRETKTLLRRLTIRAPKDGVILKSDIRPGEFVQATASSPVMVLGEIDKLQIRVDVDEYNANKIMPNQEAVAFLKNRSTYQIPLIFERIEPFVTPKKSLTGYSEERVDTRVLQIIYTFDNKLPFPVYVGQQVDVYINTEKTE